MQQPTYIRRRLIASCAACGLGLSLLAQAALAQADPPPHGPPAEAQGVRDASDHAAPDASGADATADAADDDDALNARGFSDQVALITELASAYRLRDELAAVLADDGTATARAGVSTQAKLAGLATRCEVLANSATNDLARAVLLRCQARAHAALAQMSVSEGEASRQRRLQQLRATAEKIRSLDVPDAEAAADYWQLLADLADAAHLATAVRSRQSLARQLLSGYIQAYAQERVANDYVIDARLSLASLLDDQGDQAGVVEQLDAIGELPERGPRAEQAQRLRASAQRIGKRVEIEALTTRVTLWKLSDFAGQPVLLHVYADALEHSVAMIQPIQRAITQGKLGGAAVVSLRVGDPVRGTPTAPWPTLPIDLEPGGVLDRLGVAALPALVWIDAEGKVASIGHTAAVLDRMPATRPDPEAPPPTDRGDAGPGPDSEPGEASEPAAPGGSGDEPGTSCG
ncbi:MAG: TlpA family protein disulfide reductase [Phycisphaeraceae bacterium]